jgi:hypothetical protein
MANQMIALGVRGPQIPDVSRVGQQFAQMANMMTQQRASERQAAQAQQAMQIAAAKEARDAELHPSAMSEASAKATAAELKTGMDFNNFVRAAIANSSTPDQVAGFADIIASLPQFQAPLYQDVLSRAVANMPRDPAQFEAFREETFLGTLEADKRYAREFQRQTTGREERIISMPKYGQGGATEVQGSRIEAAEGIQFLRGPNDELIPMPKTQPGTGGFGGGGAPAVGGRGPVAKALQTNPGALKDGAFTRSQPGYTGNSGGFATFSTPQAGIAAQEKLLQSAYVGRGFNTIDKIINRYAPQGPENSAASVNNYKRYISQQTGIDINAPIGAGQIPAVAQAMREFETGNTKGGGGVRMGQPIETPPTKEQRQTTRGRQNVTNTVDTLRGLYAELRQRGGAVESGKGIRGAPENIGNYIAGTAIGRPFGRALGTEEQATRDKIINVRRMLVTQIADAANLSAQEMNSNVELQGLLDAATDPTQSIETVEATLNEIEKLYGNPGAQPKRIPRAKAKAKAKTKTSTGVDTNNPLLRGM